MFCGPSVLAGNAAFSSHRDRARSGHLHLGRTPETTSIAGTRPGMTVSRLSSSRAARSIRLRDFDAPRSGAAVARRIVHVLDRGLRQHIFAGRYGAHDIRDGEHRLVVGLAVDRGRETVVAEFAMHG